MDNLLRQEMQNMKTDLSDMKGKVDKMFHAMMGSDLLQDGGLIGGFSDLKVEVSKLEDRVEDLEKKNASLEIYQKLTWAFVGSTIVGVVGYVLQLIFNK